MPMGIYVILQCAAVAQKLTKHNQKLEYDLPSNTHSPPMSNTLRVKSFWRLSNLYLMLKQLVLDTGISF